MPAISRHDSENKTALTAAQFDREKKYQAALAVAREMLQKGIINEADFLRIEARLAAKFRPVLGGIFC